MRTRSNLNSTPGGGSNGRGSCQAELARLSSIRPIASWNLACIGEPAADLGLPRALGSGERTTARGRCGAVALRSLPRPSRLRRRSRPSTGSAPKLRRGRGRDRHRDARRPARARARTATATAPTSARSPSCGSASRRRCVVEVRTARLRPTRRRNLRIVEATVADASGPREGVWFNQAWLAERLQPGDAAAAATASSTAAASASRRHEIVCRRTVAGPRRGPPASTRPGSSRSTRQRGLSRAAAPRVGLAGAARAPATRSSRCRPELRARHGLAGAADALARAHFPRAAEEAEAARARLAFEELFLHQAALAVAPRRAPRAAPRASRSAEPGRAGRRLARGRCRSRRPATSGARSPRSTPTSPPSGRCSGC